VHAAQFHDLTKYYSSSDTEPGDERIGIGDPAARTEAIWQKDWAIKPSLYKVYETAPPVELTRDVPDTGTPALEAVAATGAEPPPAVPDRALLGRLGLLTNGSLDRVHHAHPPRASSVGPSTPQYRAAGGTGALYHLELYFVCADLPDLDAGVYHYSAIDHSLRLLRAGDVRAALAAATGDEPSIAAAPVVMAMTSTFWRNAWRYRERAYRHTYWDAGTSLSHILAVAASADVATGFAQHLQRCRIDLAQRYMLGQLWSGGRRGYEAAVHFLQACHQFVATEQLRFGRRGGPDRDEVGHVLRIAFSAVAGLGVPR
jgi:SagB-type dehydrogenase family enzyme